MPVSLSPSTRVSLSLCLTLEALPLKADTLCFPSISFLSPRIFFFLFLLFPSNTRTQAYPLPLQILSLFSHVALSLFLPLGTQLTACPGLPLYLSKSSLSLHACTPSSPLDSLLRCPAPPPRHPMFQLAYPPLYTRTLLPLPAFLLSPYPSPSSVIISSPLANRPAACTKILLLPYAASKPPPYPPPSHRRSPPIEPLLHLPPSRPFPPL